MHLTLQQIRIFESVARLKSHTRAAEELNMTQPAISIQLRKLEDNAGHVLIEQTGRRFALTQAGVTMERACADILGRLRMLDLALDELVSDVRGPLSISVVTTAKYFMPRVLGAFVAEHPDVVPRLTVGNRAGVMQRLAQGADDLAIIGRVPAGMDLCVVPFLENQLVIAAPAAHPLAGQAGIDLDRLARERLLMREPGSGTRAVFESLFAARGLEVGPYMELGSTEAIKQAAIAGLGVALLPRESMTLELAGGYLTELDVVGFPLRKRWNAVHPRSRPLGKTARVFLDGLKQLVPAPPADRSSGQDLGKTNDAASFTQPRLDFDAQDPIMETRSVSRCHDDHSKIRSRGRHHRDAGHL